MADRSARICRITRQIYYNTKKKFVNQKFTIILAYTAVLLGYWQIDKSAKIYIMYVVWVKMHGIIYETNL